MVGDCVRVLPQRWQRILRPGRYSKAGSRLDRERAGTDWRASGLPNLRSPRNGSRNCGSRWR